MTPEMQEFWKLANTFSLLTCPCRPSRICGQCILARRVIRSLKAALSGVAADARERRRRG